MMLNKKYDISMTYPNIQNNQPSNLCPLANTAYYSASSSSQRLATKNSKNCLSRKCHSQILISR